jgi:4-diphosphocytidyl-2-C-methyl-D-erythritol kinase
MIIHPNAKINLGLNVVSKRPDGFHNIESCFLPIGLVDVLEIEVSDRETKIEISGIDIPGKIDENLCIKGWELIHKNYDIPPVNIKLKKVIPIGAGLGGGSSDAAFMLKLLNTIFKIGISDNELVEFATQLGSDCAFFVKNLPAIAKSKGEDLKLVTVSLGGYKLVLINPGLHISTAEAYSLVVPKYPLEDIEDILSDPPEKWTGRLVNDFELSVFKKYPKIRDIKDQLYELGAVYASMSGSGSSVYGFFKDKVPENIKDVFSGSFIWYDK